MVGLMLPGMKGAFARGKSTGMLFAIMAVYLSVLWWGCESPGMLCAPLHCSRSGFLVAGVSLA